MQLAASAWRRRVRPEKTPLIRCENLVKVFGNIPNQSLGTILSAKMTRNDVQNTYGALIAVSNVSFSIEKGKTFCIMGLSGCGKSTLIRMVNQLVQPSSGKVYVDDVEVSSLDAKALRDYRSRRIGMVFQSYGLFPHLTVVENVAFGLEIRRFDKEARTSAALEKLEVVGLTRWANSYPDELSGGMKQRVGIARALASDTDVMLMDEPFSALDPLIRRELQTEFVEISRLLGKTTIFITHDFEEAARVGDDMAIMRDGEFVQVGTAKQIIHDPKDEFVAKFVKIATEKI